MRRAVRLVTQRFEGRPELDTAISRSILDRVAAGELHETLRIFVPNRAVAFGRRDLANPSYRSAAAAAEAAGFRPIERIAGGKAVAFHPSTLAFAWARPETRPRETVSERFDVIAGIAVSALVSLGVDARIGEVPGEYCPGSHSVNARGSTKIMGVGQRLIAGAAHVGGIVVVDRPDLVNRVLVPVYEALGHPWDPAATGAVALEVATTVPATRRALIDAFAERFDLEESNLDRETLDRAEAILQGAGGPLSR